MSAKQIKDPIEKIESIFKNQKKGSLATFENIAKEFTKAPTATQAKKIKQLAEKYNIKLVSASEYAKYISEQNEKKDRRVKSKSGSTTY